MPHSASYIGTIPLNILKLPPNIGQWESYQTEDIFIQNFITLPKNYLFTLGSASLPTFATYSSRATTPAYRLPTSSQYYIAGRDVFRWGGKEDPDEVDFDRYVFTPINNNIASISKAPKSEPHHLSEIPSLIKIVPTEWQDIVNAIQNGEFQE